MTDMRREWVPVFELAGMSLRIDMERASALREAGRQLIAQADRLHADAVKPVLRMIGVAEGNIVAVRPRAAAVSDSGPSYEVLVVQPADVT